MPELPEVETVINIIEPLIKGKTIKNVELIYERLVLSSLNLFKKNLIGQTILKVTRLAKYIFIHLTNNYVLIVHLRMEGKFRYVEKNDVRNKSTSAIFYFNDSTALAFDDTRKFGIMYLSNEDEYLSLPMIKKLGIEANMVKDKDLNDLYKKFYKNKPIKELLLDQTIMSGIGNIYADEILFKTKIHPLTKGKDIDKTKIKEITINAKAILDNAIALGGSTIHSFHPSEGVDGRFQEVLMCYGKNNEPCPNCSTPFHKIFISGRGTTFCPNCQINQYIKKAIGITGPIGSGKSTVLKYLSTLGYETFSSDIIIHDLYKEPHIQKRISSILNFNFDIDNKKHKEIAREIMIKNPDIKKRIENYIYPLLEEKLLILISESDKIAIEVPLLFKAHFQYMFKKIFVLNVSKEVQIKNLSNRKEFNINNAIKLNVDYSYDKNNKDIIQIEVTGDKSDLFNKIRANL